MSKQLEVNHQSLLDAYFDYYKAKLSSREHFENIIKIDNDQYEYDHFVIRGDINNSKKKILEDLHKMVEELPEVSYLRGKKHSNIYIEYDSKNSTFDHERWSFKW